MGLLCCHQGSAKLTEFNEEKELFKEDNKKLEEEKELQINREDGALSKKSSIQKLRRKEGTRQDSNLVLSGNLDQSPVDYPVPKKNVSTAPVTLLMRRRGKSPHDENFFSSKDLITAIEESKSPITAKSLGVKRQVTTKFFVSPAFFRWENMGILNDNYEVLETVGKGRFGEVQKIRVKSTNEIRALKIIKKNECQMAKNFSEEILILQKLDHPNVVRFYEFFQNENNYYMITEYCKGGDLLDLIKNKSIFSESEAAFYMKQILTAVNYCHKNNLAHRDLKPENIVFVDDTHTSLKIIDFGRSKILTPKEKLYELAGSPYYVAPEILSGGSYNEMCDLWSCGVIMYFLVSGFPPFFGESREEINKLILKGDINYSSLAWKGISRACLSLLRQLLVVDPGQRILPEKALRHEWFELTTEHCQIMESEFREVLNNLKNFRTQMIFQRAVLTYCASQQDFKDEGKLRKIFKVLDSEKNGHLTRSAISAAFAKMYGDVKRGKKEADSVLKNIDFNRNGVIEYNEFLIANMRPKYAFAEDKLREAFNFYDKDRDGIISISDLKIVFGNFCDDSTIQNIIAELKLDNDKGISFEEFKGMMQKVQIASVFLPETHSVSD